jgi:predicted component of viral defense system (DUF524 family)
MAEQAAVIFKNIDDGEECTLTVYLQNTSKTQSNGIQALETIPIEQALAAGEAMVQLLEGVRYEYQLSTSSLRLELDRNYTSTQNIVLQSRIQGREHCGVLNPGLATGSLPLTLVDSSGNLHSRGSVEIRSRKLDYRADYQKMLGDITERCVDLLQSMGSPSTFKAEPDPGNDPTTIGQRFAFVRSLLQSQDFENALHRITSHPHQIWQHEPELRSIARGFKPTGKLQRQLALGSRRIAVQCGHPLHDLLPTLPEQISITRATLTEDTPENRFVKFALRAFHRFLDGMRKNLDPAKNARLYQEISALCTRLDAALATDVMRLASEPTFLPLGSPTLQRREGYREVLQAWSHFAMAAKLVWDGGEKVYGAGQRDVATLYEYWVFFELLKIVAQVFSLKEPASDTLIEPTGDGFGLKLKAGKYLALTGQSKQAGRNLEVRFSYNRSFRATTKQRVAGSWTQTLRPDYTLSLWPVGFTEEDAELQELMVHVHFDAKYRLEQVAEMLGDAQQDENISEDEIGAQLDLDKQDESRGSYKRADLMKMHAYRDAIRRTQGAYVIYPGQSGDAKRLEGFHEVLPGLGAFALHPGSGTDKLVEFFHDIVSHVADRTSAREQHSFHTYQTYVSPPPKMAEEHRAIYQVLPEKTDDLKIRNTPPRETFVVVGWVKNSAHFEWIKESGKYNFRMGSAEGALRLSAEVVGATYLLLHGDNNEVGPVLFKIKNSIHGPAVNSADELIAMKYPMPPTQSAYLVYDVEPAIEFMRYTWDFAALPAKPASAASGYPFATTLQNILTVGAPQLP